MHRLAVMVLLSAALSGVAEAQAPDAALAAHIDAIPAIDNHAHVTASPQDKGYDALRCDTLPPSAAMLPANLRFGPDIALAWKALYGVSVNSDASAELQQVVAAQAKARAAHGNQWQAWVLDQSHIATVLANRVAMAPQLKPPRFRWVPYDDALLFPLNNADAKAGTPDRHVFFGLEEEILREYLRAAGQSAIPPTLAGYLDRVVRPTLERQKREGAPAIKFEVAYLRSLSFDPASEKAAAQVYAQNRSGAAPPAGDYKTLQDFLFRYIAAQAGRLGLAVHIHTGAGCGVYFDDRGADPMLLESVVLDPELQKTNFVLLHGGSPYERHLVALLTKPNVYADTSVLELMFSPPELASILRPWLEIMPEHVLFGTDASPVSTAYSWEEQTWIGSRHARRALAIVLSQMTKEGVISPARAREIADGVLRGNAAALYGLK